MSSPEERRLKEHFEALRTTDASTAPPFPATLAANRGERSGPAQRWAIAAAMVVAAGLVLPLAFRPRTEPVGDIAAWSSPTAFLLETPGRQLLQETPRLGAPPLLSLPARKELSK